MVRITFALIRKLLATLGGVLLISAGLLLLFLPGPGFLLLLAGLGLLAFEYPWAKQVLQRLREKFGLGSDRLASRTKDSQEPKNKP